MELPNGFDAIKLDILVADDDELNRRMMKILLGTMGHNVELASNGAEAVAAAAIRNFDVVFMDLQMPVMDGVESSRRIRDLDNEHGHPFIVALTASYLPEQGKELIEAGIENYIAKPFEMGQIKRMLDYRTKAKAAGLSNTSPPADDALNAPQTLDIKKGIMRVGGDEEAYQSLLTDLFLELPERIGTLKRLYFEEEYEKLSRAAHNLKGVSANLGALRMSVFAGNLENESSTGYTLAIEQMLDKLTSEAQNLQQACHEYMPDVG